MEILPQIISSLISAGLGFLGAYLAYRAKVKELERAKVKDIQVGEASMEEFVNERIRIVLAEREGEVNSLRKRIIDLEATQNQISAELEVEKKLRDQIEKELKEERVLRKKLERELDRERERRIQAEARLRVWEG